MPGRSSLRYQQANGKLCAKIKSRWSCNRVLLGLKHTKITKLGIFNGIELEIRRSESKNNPVPQFRDYRPRNDKFEYKNADNCGAGYVNRS